MDLTNKEESTIKSLGMDTHSKLISLTRNFSHKNFTLTTKEALILKLLTSLNSNEER